MAHLDNLIDFWDLKSNANGALGAFNGTNNGGTFSGSEWTGGSGKYIDLGNSSTLNPTGSCTISGWFKTTATGSRQMLFTRDDNSLGRAYAIAFNQGGGNQNYIVDIATGAEAQVNGSETIVSDTWMHIVGVYDGSNVIIYVNGNKTTGGSHTGATISATGATRIGARTYSGFEDYLSGAAKAVEFYNAAKDDAWVAETYNSGVTKFYADWSGGGGAAKNWWYWGAQQLIGAPGCV